jgi:hypothetical protein
MPVTVHGRRPTTAETNRWILFRFFLEDLLLWGTTERPCKGQPRRPVGVCSPLPHFEVGTSLTDSVRFSRSFCVVARLAPLRSCRGERHRGIVICSSEGRLLSPFLAGQPEKGFFLPFGKVESSLKIKITEEMSSLVVNLEKLTGDRRK